MRGTSQASRSVVLRQFDPVASAAGKDGAALAARLFGVVDALDRSASLRRALTDPAASADAKEELVGSLLGGADPRVRDVLALAVAARWSEEHDLADVVEDAAVDALLGAAQGQGSLDAVEDELFRVERALVAERDLLAALGNRSASPAARGALAREVFAGKVSAVTLALVERAVTTPRGRRLQRALASFVAAAADRRQRSIAHVTAAVELTPAQRQRLAGILAEAYGREVRINVAVDPSVVGGIRVQVGDEVVDGTIAARLDEARRRLVG